MFTLLLREDRGKANISALAFIYSGHRNSVSVGLARSLSTGILFFYDSPSDSLVQPAVKATDVCKETLDDILQ